MNRRILGVAALLWIPISFAADMDQEANAVWAVIASSWEDQEAKNNRWPAEYVHDDVVSWGVRWPAPQRKQSLVEWERFDNEARDYLKHELFPMEVVVVGDTATAHYAAVVVSKNAEGEREREVLGLVETLVRQGDEWKFLSLAGFPIGDEQ